MVSIYFCGSIRGGRQLALTYASIIKMIQEHGKVLTEHLGDDEQIKSKDRILPDREIHDRDMDWIRESDLLIAEVTVPSLGVGYELGRAIEMGKPVLCLFNTGSPQPLSAMIAGSESVEMCYYEDLEELKETFEQFISQHAPRRIS
ncbi:MAG: nucleoside 2-deoxyribosyltransferase [Bacteroidota bacterium]